jgi:serine/threonine protein kinase
MTVLLDTPRTNDGGEGKTDADDAGGGADTRKVVSFLAVPQYDAPSPVAQKTFTESLECPRLQAFSSPSSCSTSSTRIPDSDSEEFLLDDKDDVGTTSEEEGDGVANAACGVEPDRQAAEVETDAASVRQEIRCRRRPESLSKPCDTNLAWFRYCSEVNFASWVPGDFTLVGTLAKSVHGEVRNFTARSGSSVVAKVILTDKLMESRSKVANERLLWLSDAQVTTVEDPWNEIAVLSYLHRISDSCDSVLKLLGVFQDMSSTYLLTEHCEGGELFERVAYGDALCAKDAQRYLFQILLAVRHLHGHNVGHRDISLENVLLRHGRCVLMDFGQAVRLRTIDGTELRYFAEAGKRMYRSPEMYVPREKSIQIICPSDAEPGAVTQVPYDRSRCQVLLPSDASPGLPCRAEPYGYTVAAADLFACGVCAFVLAVGKPPWAVARDIDPTFSFIRRHGVEALLRQWRVGMEFAEHEEDSLLAAMLQVCPLKRPSVTKCLSHAWFADCADDAMETSPVPTEAASADEATNVRPVPAGAA